jgi:tRNA(adenine34) deaminase
VTALVSKTLFTSPTTDEHWMKVALAEADLAASHGDVPVGCVIVRADGTLLAKGRNRRELDRDPTAHAEIVALRAAAQELGNWQLDGTTLYVTLEPCVMCAGALVNARVSRVVYGAADPKAGAIDSLYSIGQDPVLNHRFAVDAGYLKNESLSRLQRFFAQLRAIDEK